MFGPRNKYVFEFSISKESLIERFVVSSDFQIEGDYGYFGTASNKSRLNEVFIRQSDSNIFQLSENAGLGGLFEIIGTAIIEPLEENKSLLKIKFQMGIFPVNLPQVLILALLLLGIILIPITPAFLFLSIIICFILSFWWLVSYIRVRILLGIVSKAIGVENKRNNI